ncbi:MAG: tRNA 5-methoxyuridine(34)/uridine 5-oxyacetic acid(34) synthase CmoB [Sinobacterium sp.]|nr:tRNA 5-methoxyuridine(34)/uridine 5-oxyacetic acid(34) synthase CmoB [Sinobacterium sp.]
MNDFSDFFQNIPNTLLERHTEALHTALNTRLATRNFGDLETWQQGISTLPTFDDMSPVDYRLDQDTISLSSSTEIDKTALSDALKALHPWRKGPFNLFDVFIDTEWRSDFKWQRVLPHLSPLKNKLVLDVGCGSGYHCWRMRGEGAKLVVGIEPSPKFLLQFDVFKRYMPEEPVHVLPLLSEDLPPHMQSFDTVFSMGVLYHRKSPIEHLEELKGALKKGGELVLETLVVEGDEQTCLIPGERYAQMRNVWFLPSTAMLEKWLERLGFSNIRTVDINQTSNEEQRPSEWMTFHSLDNFLDPNDKNLTIEGYPAPKRAIIIANK